MIKEFKAFISQGNAVDLAIGVIIGVAFGAIVNSIVSDLIMPVIGIVIGGINFAELKTTIGSAVLSYGKLIQAVINFIIIAIVLFILVKGINRFRTKKEDIPIPPTKDQELLIEIRDLLKSK